MGLGVRRLDPAESVFGIQAASRLMTEIFAPWVQDLGLLVESIESAPPSGAAEDWQPGAIIRLPFSRKLCGDSGKISAQALMAAADAAMAVACAAALNGYRAMSAIDQTTHFLQAVDYDVLADARILRLDRTATVGRVTLASASDRRPVGLVSSAYAVL
jgi:acyl-coenzyme A thioesterase PaaI-like protein